jgi:putative endonuclease
MYHEYLPYLKYSVFIETYILRLKSGSLYIGATTDLKQRYQDHLNGQACRTTKLDPPLKIVYSESVPTFSDARKREAQIKRWSRAKKRSARGWCHS